MSNVQLFLGDCIEIVPTLPAQSVDAILTDLSGLRVIAPLSLEMASVAQADQIVEAVGISGRSEIGKANKMVNVKFLSVCLFSYATLLAGVIVTLTGAVSLPVPVIPVIVFIAAAPVCMIFAGVPLVRAIGRAKAETARALQRCGDDNVFSALFAVKFFRVFCRRLGCNHAPVARCEITGERAHRNKFGSYLKGLALKFFTANLANKRDLFLHPLRPKFVRTFTRAGSLPTVFQSAGIGKIGLLTVRACSFNHAHIIA